METKVDGTGTNSIRWEPLRLSYKSPSFTNEEAALAGRQDVWHKFLLFHVGEPKRREILMSVMSACDPEIILPVAYRVEAPDKSSFLAKSNASAVKNLVKQKLRVNIAAGQELRIDIVLGFLAVQDLQLNPNRMIAQALHNRYEPTKKILNLDNFENDKALGSIFCPIAIPRILHLVLRCARMGILGMNRDARLPVRELSLKCNNIAGIVLFEKLFNYHLTKLDIRHNEVCDIEYLRYFTEFKISELWLDGNPLCAKYTDVQGYIEAVKSIFPHLQRLDGLVIGMEQKFVPTLQTNYLGKKDHTRLGLVQQFVKHYFTLYDQEDRSIMNGLYARDAFYSMTLGPRSNHIDKEVIKSFASNRNLLKFVDYAKCQESLLRGPEKIINALGRQPATAHSFKTFHVDLLHAGDHHVALCIQGLFTYREVPCCPPIFFSRTFVLVKKEDNEYSIINDQYYLDGPAANSEARSEPRPAPKYVPTVLSRSEREQLVKFLHELTTMNPEFCRKFLDQARWDIRNAITTFTKRYTTNDVPPEAFL